LCIKSSLKEKVPGVALSGACLEILASESRLIGTIDMYPSKIIFASHLWRCVKKSCTV
jgi:hypothetical protein